MTQTEQKSLVTTRPASDVWSRNEVIFMGNIGRDPEMSYTKAGKALTKFSLAVSLGKDKDTMWLNIVCWEALAEEINNLAKKGMKVEVRGRLIQRIYNEKYYHDVIADSIEIIERSNKHSTSRSASQTSGASFMNDNDDSLGELDDHPF